MKTVLHPTDGSESSQKALDFAVKIAAGEKARLIVLYAQRRHGVEGVLPELRDLEYVEHVTVTEAEVLRANAQRLVDEIAQSARKKGASDVESLVVEGDPVRVILAVAEDRKVDAIVMGSRGRGDLEGLLLGSVSHKIVQLAPCTCVLVR